MNRNSIFLTFIGVAGSGKTTLSEMLRKEFSSTIMRSISATSRLPRENEKNGVDYYFLSKDEFQRRVSSGEFFEWEETHGNLYGTLRTELLRAQTEKKDLVLDIDIRGALSFKKEYPQESSVVLLLPPSKNAILKRLKDRKTGEKDLEIRLKTAEGEYDLILDSLNQIDYVVINDKLEQAFLKIKAIYQAESQSMPRLKKDELQKICKV